MLDAPSFPIRRRSLREDVIDILRERLTAGELTPGQRINESQLSAGLGVSRTPLREALLHMEKEGLVVSEPARGFSAAPLSLKEAREACFILGGLESLAFRSAGGLIVRRVPALAELQEAYGRAPDLRTASELDDRWHETLVAGCGNDRLVELTAQWRRVTGRYARDPGLARWPHAAALVQHRAILDALHGGDGEGAVAALERHWAATTRELLSALTRTGVA